MNVDIRRYILDNFKDASADDIKSSITDSITDRDDVTLPGLGVFFEVLWSNSSEDERKKIINVLNKCM